MAGTKNMLFSISFPNTLNTDAITQTISKRPTSKIPRFLSSCNNKLKTLKLVKATLAMDLFQVKVDHVPSILKVTATVTVKVSNEISMMKIPWLYSQNDMKPEEKGVGFQLVSTQLDPSTKKPKVSKECVNNWWKCSSRKAIGEGCFRFEVELEIDADFGEPGAILAYLPSQTPNGLKNLRLKELENKRGDGNGHRLPSDRIYDYDTYNDLGNPDKGAEYARPTLGDVTTEIPVNTMISSIYVPRDEALEGTRRKDIHMGIWKGVLHNIPPMLATLYNDNGVPRDFEDITCLYRNIPQVEMSLNMHGLLKFLDIRGSIEEIFKFETPKNLSWNVTSYVQDDHELGRQTLAGMNPVSIEKLKVYPPVSKLDPTVYGPLESALKEEHIICHLNGMSVQQALDENKLFILDYHDIYLPFLERINSQQDRKAYATCTIFFLTTMGTLKPIAIELSLPPTDTNIPSKQVLTPPADATTNWLWKLGKAHVCSNDNGVHQLIHHWLRVHACMEPFIIATHRHLSSLHPIFKLLSLHMKHALAINAMARESLISAEGIIECGFSPGKYSNEMVCAAYRDWWCKA
ncbi:hypothetical protein L1987_58650 [Smallanthus sonchifolius]|uniref:Uncharacterized protein n=1 Tax=Smallanthus sonchifolius TaxID=185202 RepID=A0ACB9DGE1_9ASTR|nr:hypothetical protein L1987_58650 [Smallanthus sonchifolius]